MLRRYTLYFINNHMGFFETWLSDIPDNSSLQSELMLV